MSSQPRNSQEIYLLGLIVTVSRRFLNKATGKTRVRVVIKTMGGEVKVDEHRDFTDMHDADDAYSKQIRTFTEMGGER